MGKIIAENLTVTYTEGKKTTVLTEINLTIKAGEFVCIIGPSGCGKSTLLRVLEGLKKPDQGTVLIDNKVIKGPGPDRGVVFQHYSLFPWLTAKKNIIFGMKHSINKYSKNEMNEIANKYLEKVGLLEDQDKYPSQLSGGMQQRIAVARAMAMNADILLMDEPFGAIDPKHRSEVQELVSKLCTEENKTVVFVTHDIDEAILLADRIVFMEPGKIKSDLVVDLPKPRKKEDLFGTQEYIRLHNNIMSLFYNNVSQSIGGEEVCL